MVLHKAGDTNWNSTDQYGKESCADLGFDGADTLFKDGLELLTRKHEYLVS